MRISDWSSDVCSSDLLIVYRSRQPAAERHAAEPEEDQRRDPPAGLGRREMLAQRQLVARNDAAEPEAEGGREHVEADEVVDEAEERHADRLTGGAEQHGAQAADAVREMAQEYPAAEGREEQQRQHPRTARRGASQGAAEGD